ncbi:MAG: flagellar motor switch protein FliM [Thermodesulfobacteriota bacterium]
MAEQILSQVEVDALLKGLSNGDIETEVEQQDKYEGEIRPYDFADQDKTYRGSMPALEMINEKFSRAAGSPIFNMLRKSVDVTPAGVKIMKYEEFIRNLQMPSSLNIFSLAPLRGQGILVIDPNLVFHLVDSYFGGDGRFHTRIEGRDFTNVEQGVIKKMVELLFHELGEIWKAVQPMEFTLTRTEMNPQFVNITGHMEPVVVSTFNMEIESASNKFFYCIPYTSLVPIRDKLCGTQKADFNDTDNKWRDGLNEQFRNIPVEVAAEIGKACISVSELLNLKEGDVIQLDRKVKEPVRVSIEGVPKLFASPGLMDTNYAIKIMSTINAGREQ